MLRNDLEKLRKNNEDLKAEIYYESSSAHLKKEKKSLINKKNC